jgi:hypothetical protein
MHKHGRRLRGDRLVREMSGCRDAGGGGREQARRVSALDLDLGSENPMCLSSSRRHTARYGRTWVTKRALEGLDLCKPTEAASKKISSPQKNSISHTYRDLPILHSNISQTSRCSHLLLIGAFIPLDKLSNMRGSVVVLRGVQSSVVRPS